MPEKCLLLLDSYGGQNDDNTYGNNDKLKRMTIPPRTTSSLQPLDYGVFRYCKLVAKRITNFDILEQISINLKDSNNIIKMWSLIFNQFSSDKFTNLFKHAWICLDINPQKLEHLNIYEILFNLGNGTCKFCNSTAFICCIDSYCNENLF